MLKIAREKSRAIFVFRNLSEENRIFMPIEGQKVVK
jgi:hypothetical protein